MKKTILIIICFICMVGCSSTTDIKEKENNLNVSSSKLKSKYTSKEWKCSVPLENIKDISGFENVFITNEGELYEFSLEKLYSNDDYCKKIESNYKFTRFINGAIITEDNKIFGYINNEFIEEPFAWTGAFRYDLYKQHNNIFKFDKGYNETSFDVTGITYYGYLDGNKIIVLDGIESNIAYTYDLKDDEIFLGSYYEFIKTNKGYYYNGIINSSECNKYADVECVYGVKAFTELNDEYDNIYFFNGRQIIFKDDMKHLYVDTF